MRHAGAICLTSAAISLVLGLSCTASRQTQPPLSRVVAPARRASADQLRAAYGAAIDALLPGMGHAEEVQRQQSQRALESICLRAARPGAEAHRAALCRAIAARLGPDAPRPARVWMTRQLEHIGRGEIVPALAALLNDADPRIREVARRCLQHDPDPAAASALRRTLARVVSPEWRVALINALAARADRQSVALFGSLARDPDRAVAAAAIAALGQVGGSAAAGTLAGLRPQAPQELRPAVRRALLRCAEKFVARGEPQAGATIYQQLYDSAGSPAGRLAALGGLVRARPEQTLPLLLELVSSPREPLGVPAARLAEQVPGPAATRRIAAALPAAAPEAQVLLLQTLAARGDAAALPAALEAATSPEQPVRIAALQALATLGDRSTAVLLAERAAATRGDEQQAARTALDRLAGQGVDQTLVAAIDTARPPVRVELIRALGARHYAPGSARWLLEAAASEDEPVQVAALKLLADLARQEDLPALLRLLASAAGDDARQAAIDALAATCRRIPDEQRRPAPLLAALEDARGATRAALVRVLGRVGGRDALAAVRSALTAEDQLVATAALRALAGWQTPAALPDLLRIAGHDPSPTRRALALRGYVTLLRRTGARPASQTLRMLRQALNLSERPEERRLVLAALARVPHPGALQAIAPCLADREVHAEAAAALLAAAEALSAQHRAAAMAAVRKVEQSAASDQLRERVRQTVARIERFDNYCTDWLLAGPYTRRGQGAAQLFDTHFAPELLGAQTDWRPLKPTDPAQPWRFNLAQAVGGTNRCVYLRTRVWSASAQPARLEVGSDDGVKVWLNGKIIHQANVARGLTVAQDNVDVTLQPGWNELLLKITQGGGDWGFAAGFRAPDGAKLPGIRFSAE